MDSLGHRLSRPEIVLHLGIFPVVKNRILPIAPDSDSSPPDDECTVGKLDDALIPYRKQNQKKDGQLELYTLTFLRSARRPASLDWGNSPQVHLGDIAPCVDYSAQSLTVWNWHLVIIDFGVYLNLVRNLRIAQSEAAKSNGTNASSPTWLLPMDG